MEYNVAREAAKRGATLVRFDLDVNGFVPAELPRDFGDTDNKVRALLCETPVLRRPLSKWAALRQLRRLDKRLSQTSVNQSDDALQSARRDLAWLLAYNYEFLPVAERFEIAFHAHALAPHTHCDIFSYWVATERANAGPSEAPAGAVPIVWRRGDKLLSLAANWTVPYTDSLVNLSSKDVTVIVLIYDMIPLTHPTLMSSEESARFVKYVERVTTSPIHLATISRSSQQAFNEFSRRSLPCSKEIAVVPLASNISAHVATLTAKISEARLEQAPFVLMAGSFEPRKNQKYVLDIWRAVLREVPKPPLLVFAGGLAQPPYLNELRREARDLDGVHFFYNVQDEELAWLYQHCLFTVFPSQAEGWGLPITEALDHGKYCLASADAALQEAGEGLIFHASLEDRRAWIEELRTLLTDESALEKRTRRVRENHHTRTWADVARALMDLPAGQIRA